VRPELRIWGLVGGLLVVAALLGPAASAGADSCSDCHRNLDDPRLESPVRDFAQDIHFQRGLGCVACHGGDPADPEITAMDPDKGFRGAPERNKIAELCASCHANAAYMKRFNPRPYVFSVAEFRTSVHCKKIAEGDLKVATCTNCHGVHGILSHRNPRSPVYPTNVPATCAKCHNPDYMKGRKVPTDQYALYVRSVHGRALLEKGDVSAPACNDCHGNHGATPPKTRDIAIVCGNCHGREGELFASSPLSPLFVLEGKRGCVTCHGNHGVQQPADSMVSVGSEGVCGRCHEKGSLGDQRAREIVAGFHAVKDTLALADSTLTLAERRGMETSAGRQAFRESRDKLMEVRVALHSFDPARILGIATESAGLAAHARREGEAANRDWRTRRLGMAVSLAVILLLIGLLILKIRRMESPG
jgi:predicted CXXCH cytochrome family protein